MSKKGAKTEPEQHYTVRDIVLAKVRGFPPWPGMVVDPDSVPENVLTERPHTAKSKKGNWYCVRFFPAGDYAWIVPKDISKLQEHEIQAYINEPAKKSADLLQGYRIALDPTKWEAELESARVAALDAEADAEVDQLEDDDAEEDAEDDGEAKKAKPKKRKRDSDAAATKPKPKPKAKKEAGEPAAKKKPAATPAKGKKNGAKSKAMVESEDEGGAEPEGEDAGPSGRASPPPTKKAKRDKEDEEGDASLEKDPEAQKVRDWRHKLQKAFLNTKAVPKDEDMPGLDRLFSTVESYDGMNIQYLQFSKIGKVMRHIYALTPEKVPRDDEFKFRDRAKSLVDKWQGILNAHKANGAPESKPAANGAQTDAKSVPVESADAEPATNGKDEGKDESKPEEAEKLEVAESAAPAEPAKDDAPAPEADAMAVDKPAAAEDASAAADAADESVLADVTMSEAAA
ncbi:hypothetical protein CERSUDRAFT_117909 [Gelatoporia subvermispora B]|uniref:PWWP domain-containing protein n=1 Tax=Ceriporiopsis subvermispora (strain B) TaxID=914234 RepID=M2QA95_CERS8|nr:hypothetical protein CERSUDRAFT_117909 [Gelatoporia subvermispora B]